MIRRLGGLGKRSASRAILLLLVFCLSAGYCCGLGTQGSEQKPWTTATVTWW